MKVCFPVQQNEGIDSKVYNHFGSAPLFILVDTESGALSQINNGDQHHAHGACNPLKALDGQKIDAVVVGGIGGGALSRLNQSGVRVYRAQSVTVRENLSRYADKNLPEYTLQSCCGGHSHGGNCAH
ncbi:MAG: diguanylate cyclase [Nitrospirae bacterium GWD2_57_9]|nr:MAG: diguanylate cyclase [Nitrospirae bacterium GWD2_57_9]OGW48755.1 MAG: diguanylate cyclase [Nitrospirae bacterium GWC2_57_9]